VRILLVTAEYPPAPCGGIGVFYRALANQLGELGEEVHVVTPGREGADASRGTEQGVEVHRPTLPPGRPLRVSLGHWRLDSGPITRARAFSAAARVIAREVGAEVVETHDWSAPLWRAPARPFVVRLHGASSVLARAGGKPASRLQRLLERRMLTGADELVAVSEWTRRKSAETFRIDPATMEMIPNGVDTRRFHPDGASRHEEIVFAGTLREDKGVLELLQALEIVLRRRPGAAATLAGGPDRWYDLSPRLRASIERVQMMAPNRLRLLGRIDHAQLPELFRRAAVCVFPSHVEAFGLACVEAMSCGAAVVASGLAAGPEIVEDGRSGLVIDPRAPDRIADALLRVLERPELRDNLGREARRRVCERYSIRAAAEATLALYHKALREKEPWRTTRVA
jgi:glycosyltransferase involved in cell wall biosynthesis